MSHERTLHSERVYQGRLVSLRIDTVDLASGRQTQREIVERLQLELGATLRS